MRRARGQAVVELAVLLAFFTTVVLGGLYFYEAMRGLLLTQQANAAVAWDATGYSDNMIHAAVPMGCSELLEATGGRLGRTASRQGLFTQSQAFALKCTSVRDPAPACIGGVLDRAQRPVIRKSNRFTFQVSSSQRMFGSTEFLKDQQTWSAAGLPLCGLGLPQNGQCVLAYQLITEDWHVEDDRDCKLQGCVNLEYQAATRRLFDPAAGNASRLATFVAGSSPLDESKFWVSRTDFGSNFIDPTTPMGDVRRGIYPTGPGPAPRQKCFLGLGCR